MSKEIKLLAVIGILVIIGAVVGANYYQKFGAERARNKFE